MRLSGNDGQLLREGARLGRVRYDVVFSPGGELPGGRYAAARTEGTIESLDDGLDLRKLRDVSLELNFPGGSWPCIISKTSTAPDGSTVATLRSQGELSLEA